MNENRRARNLGLEDQEKLTASRARTARNRLKKDLGELSLFETQSRGKILTGDCGVASSQPRHPSHHCPVD
jgi:hypothetical protein